MQRSQVPDCAMDFDQGFSLSCHLSQHLIFSSLLQEIIQFDYWNTFKLGLYHPAMPLS